MQEALSLLVHLDPRNFFVMTLYCFLKRLHLALRRTKRRAVYGDTADGSKDLDLFYCFSSQFFLYLFLSHLLFLLLSTMFLLFPSLYNYFPFSVPVSLVTFFHTYILSFFPSHRLSLCPLCFFLFLSKFLYCIFFIYSCLPFYFYLYCFFLILIM
jgi:hypothetical protein